MGKKIVVIGGVAGGASGAARLRRLDETAEIILLERGPYISFANCGLPYYIGGEITRRDDLTLQTPESFRARFNVDVRVRHEAVAIQPDRKTVTVSDLEKGTSYDLEWDELILSMGAAPIVPPGLDPDLEGIFVLRSIPDTDRILAYQQAHRPKSAVVVGGGYIGVEMAENLTRAGLQVTIVELAGQVIAPLDPDVACEVHRHLQSKGVDLLLNTGVTGIERAGKGLAVRLGDRVLEAGLVVLAVGVRPETAIAKAAGVPLSEQGAILVDGHMRTATPHIWAVGDAVEVTDFVSGQPAMIPLAGPANRQGRIAADNICGLESSYTGTQGSAILRVFDLTVAATGINEKTAARLGLDYDKVFTFSPSHAGYYPGSANISAKYIFEKPGGKILGVQMVGTDGVDKRCDVVAAAIRFGATAGDLTRLELCYAPPYSSARDPVNIAGFAMENVLNGLVKNFHWHDVEALPTDGSVTLLDVRTPEEYDQGYIGGFVNIPLDALRGRLDRLDPAKPVYVCCQVGLRGYMACRILSQNGYQCFNLSGGYRLYSAVMGREVKGSRLVIQG